MLETKVIPIYHPKGFYSLYNHAQAPSGRAAPPKTFFSFFTFSTFKWRFGHVKIDLNRKSSHFLWRLTKQKLKMLEYEVTKLWKWLENQNWTISLNLNNILKNRHLPLGSLIRFLWKKLLAASLDTFTKLRPKWEGKKIPDNTKYLMEKVVLDWIGSIETSKLLDLEDYIYRWYDSSNLFR